MKQFFDDKMLSQSYPLGYEAALRYYYYPETPACQPAGRGFESRTSDTLSVKK